MFKLRQETFQLVVTLKVKLKLQYNLTLRYLDTNIHI